MPFTDKPSFKAFLDSYAWGHLEGDELRRPILPCQEGKTKKATPKESAQAAYCARTFIQVGGYLPLIGMIGAIALLIFSSAELGKMLTGSRGEEDRAAAARLVVTAIALGPLLLLVDLIGTIVKASFHQFPKK